jgi:uncharacterized membrane protein YobD (UPF0266 family)
MVVTAGIFLASILLKEMRYLVYIRYLLVDHGGFFFARIFFKFGEAVEGVEAVQELFLYPVSQKYYRPTLLLFGH